MPTEQHAQPPPEDAPPPRRRDHESPAAGHDGPPPMTAAQRRAYRDAWLDEMWPACPELPREQREIDRAIVAAHAHHHGPGRAA